MTVIVAVKDRAGVIMAADSQTTFGWEQSTSVIPKIIERVVGERRIYIGVSGDVRFADVVRYATLPDDGSVEVDAHQWLSTVFVSALRSAAKDAGWTKKENEREDHSCIAIVVTGGRLFHFSSDWALHEPARSYWAIGGGWAYATGALSALEKYAPNMPTSVRVTAALDAACAHNIGCGAPYHTVACL